MCKLPTYFGDFLHWTPPATAQGAQKGREVVRARLQGDEDPAARMVIPFPRGSDRRSTILEPQGGAPGNVDIVVTNLHAIERGPVRTVSHPMDGVRRQPAPGTSQAFAVPCWCHMPRPDAGCASSDCGGQGHGRARG